ncbi:DUF4428 domain-containing protein [Clostridium sardiniense]|uniref:DUF4428 domain-containing protein n=1 Tax=Clostridium sardiniense TaxID=29369 RepID=UPI00195BB54A|nr:DUF4428 domain-containing protein [Clostridium sardiniense]MBM7836341.1 DNA-directed RNA polymerase subunit RPC12/RpoP [Clostridium sardiniense]
MGFFSLKGVCDVCGKEYGFNKFKYKDGYLCPECNKKVLKRLKHTSFKVTIAEVKEIMESLGEQSNRCDACGKELGAFYNKCADGIVCGTCANIGVKKLGKTSSKVSLAELAPFVDAEKLYQEHLQEFTPTKKIGSFLEVDENKGEWLVPDGFFGGKKHPRIFKFKDIVNYELLVNESSVASGGVGRAIAGGVLFGATGAIVGGVTGKKRSKNVIDSMKIKITVDDLQYPVVYINIISSSTKTDSILYKPLEKQAQECLSVLDLLVNKFAKNQVSNIQDDGNKDFMFCKECGTKIPRDSKFCSNCGEKI